MFDHKKKTITFKDITAEVDEDLVDLIQKLWELDIYTTNSCQDDVPNNWVWIEFFDAFSAENFLNIAAGEYNDDVHSLYNQIRQAWGQDDGYWWKYQLSIDDIDIDTDLDADDGMFEYPKNNVPKFNFSISIRFPRQHLEEVKVRVLGTDFVSSEPKIKTKSNFKVN